MVLETNVLVVNRLQQTDNDVDSLRSFDAAETEIAIPTVTVQDHVREMLVDLRDASSAPAACQSDGPQSPKPLLWHLR